MSLRITEQELSVLQARQRKCTVRVPVAETSQTPADGAKRLLKAILEAGLPGHWYRDFIFHEERDWRVDCAAPEMRVGVEVDGAVHRIKKRFKGDIEKHNALMFADWRYLRVTPAQVDSGEALVLLRALLEQERKAA